MDKKMRQRKKQKAKKNWEIYINSKSTLEKQKERIAKNWEKHMEKGKQVEKERVKREWEKHAKKNWEEHMKDKRPQFKTQLTDITKKFIERKKQEIVKKYGTKPTVCYFYYLYNAVDYVGEKNLRESFASIQGQGNEIIIGDYSSSDNTVEIAKEYGFKIVHVEKEPGIIMAQSKIWNKIIKETKCNFMVELDVHIEYPNINNFIVEWLQKNDITKKMLVLRGLWINKEGIFQREYGFGPAPVWYKPYLIEARGYDERCYMGFGATQYGVALVKDVYNLVFDDQHFDNMIHKFHISEKEKTLRMFYGVDSISEAHIPATQFAMSLIDKLRENFEEGVKNVRNNYW